MSSNTSPTKDDVHVKVAGGINGDHEHRPHQPTGERKKATVAIPEGDVDSDDGGDENEDEGRDAEEGVEDDLLADLPDETEVCWPAPVRLVNG